MASILAASFSLCIVHFSDGDPMIASATLYLAGDLSQTVGTITFTQESCDSSVVINGSIDKIPPNNPNGQFGFHVHELGTLEGNCTACSGHYNPTDGTHGAPWNDTRHNGDLGNVNFTKGNSIQVSFSDSVIQLTGDYSILGRTLVLHAGTDDYGMDGTNNESALTGDAGARFACGIIGNVNNFNQLRCGADKLTNSFRVFAMIAIFVCFKTIFV